MCRGPAIEPAFARRETNLGHSGAGIYWSPSACDSWISYYEVRRNEEIIDSFRGGAIEFLWKPFPIASLLKAIDIALQKDMQREERMRKVHAVAQRVRRLTPREREFMLRMIDGHTNKEIAEIESVTADNIKKYRASILEKMQVASLASLIVLCREAGITPATGLPVDERDALT